VTEPLNFQAMLPELILMIGAMALLMLGIFAKRERGEMILWLSLGLLALAGVAVTYSSGTVTLFNDSFIIDAYARALKLLTLIGAGVTVYAVAVIGLGAIQVRQLLGLLRGRRPAADDS